MSDDTRQNPGNRPDLVDQVDDLSYDENTVEDTVLEIKELMGLRSTLENYRDQVAAAGTDGLDPIAKLLMQVNMRRVTIQCNSVGMESFNPGTVDVSTEDFSEALKGVGEKIMALINKLIDMAKQFAAKIMSGVESVKTQAEELMTKIKKRAGGSTASNEFHDGDPKVTISSPGILFSDGEFCLDDCRSEQEVIKFFMSPWPKYAIDQVNRAKKMISEYDVESGNSENFESNAGFIGNHESLVANIKKSILPGNKSVGFKYVALGPDLVDAEGAQEAPESHTFNVRTEGEINGTLRKNIATMNALGGLFKQEAEVLNHMATLSKALGDLESRRGETVWKSARGSLDEISNMMMDLITRLKPNYDPIVRHLAKVGSARNAAVRKELDARA